MSVKEVTAPVTYTVPKVVGLDFFTDDREPEIKSWSFTAGPNERTCMVVKALYPESGSFTLNEVRSLRDFLDFILEKFARARS
jgi:hypothetical protein